VEDSEEADEDFYTISYSDDGGQGGVEHIFKEYGVVNAETMAAYIFKYPLDAEDSAGEMKIMLSSSLKLPEGGKSAARGFDPSVFSLRDGRVYKGEVELDAFPLAFPTEIAAEIEGPLRYWAAVGSEIPAVAENETGVLFFTESGECVTFLPLESAYECQGILFSPDGTHFLLESGSGMRADMTYILYDPRTMEQKVEFPGIRGCAAWIDAGRFVMTLIDDGPDGVRAGGTIPGFSYGLYLSAVMYDAVAEETVVLKKATATQNFWAGEVTDDGASFVIQEEFVESENDWDDEEKIKTREIKVDLPPAG
jgi:hypothetical protein